eukprot:SAG31_NODE_984_length_10552_cov_4.679231_2_plen_191_part_00
MVVEAVRLCIGIKTMSSRYSLPLVAVASLKVTVKEDLVAQQPLLLRPKTSMQVARMDMAAPPDQPVGSIRQAQVVLVGRAMAKMEHTCGCLLATVATRLEMEAREDVVALGLGAQIQTHAMAASVVAALRPTKLALVVVEVGIMEALGVATGELCTAAADMALVAVAAPTMLMQMAWAKLALMWAMGKSS